MMTNFVVGQRVMLAKAHPNSPLAFEEIGIAGTVERVDRRAAFVLWDCGQRSPYLFKNDMLQHLEMENE